MKIQRTTISLSRSDFFVYLFFYEYCSSNSIKIKDGTMSKTRELAKGNKDKREVREASKCHEAKAKMGTETGCSFL